MDEVRLPIVFSAQPAKLDATSPNVVVPGMLGADVGEPPPPPVGNIEPRVQMGR